VIYTSTSTPNYAPEQLAALESNESELNNRSQLLELASSISSDHGEHQPTKKPDIKGHDRRPI
jgi:hypothetical protein